MEKGELKVGDTESQLLLAFYGDDFTGSTDALEALAKSGAKTVLFLAPPSAELLAARFPDVRCVGVAGVSRSLGPEEMERELRPAFEALRELGPKVVHYKVCSTFDSSPHVGSIGKAVDIGAEAFGRQRFVPVLAGVPALGRYTLFGHHFAASIGGIYRLDRHPVMSRHPVTPMDEADLRLHLAKQTERSIGLLSVLDQQAGPEAMQVRLEERLREGCGIILFDVLDDALLKRVGGLLWREAERGPLFAAGSSGVEYALAAHWIDAGLIGDSFPSPREPGPAEQLLVISGSCSPVTAGQIDHSLRQGFALLKAPVLELAHSDPARVQQAEERLVLQAEEALRSGRSVVVCTSLGPDDDTIGPLRELLASRGLPASESGRLLGAGLGRAARRLAAGCGLRRLLVAGGDTSGYIVKELGIYALELLAPLVPGGPLCRAFAEEPALDGLELALKGGQVGPPDYFVRVQQGRLDR